MEITKPTTANKELFNVFLDVLLPNMHDTITHVTDKYLLQFEFHCTVKLQGQFDKKGLYSVELSPIAQIERNQIRHNRVIIFFHQL